MTNENVFYGNETLPTEIRSRYVNNNNGLDVHILEAGFGAAGRPCVLLLHGFPELSYSWRKVMPVLAHAGFHVVAPDQRGYGRTTGWDGTYDGDVASFRFMNLVKDTIGLVFALGYRTVAGVVGHDFGSPVAAWCSLIRPDIFRSVVMMSAPFGGPPILPFDTDNNAVPSDHSEPDIHDSLSKLSRPRKHYQWYYSTRDANGNMSNCPQGVHDFLRAYYHFKSADWKGNMPFPLTSWSAEELAKLPNYYIMDKDSGMADTVAAEMPSPSEIAACKWLTDEDLSVYSGEYARTGFQGGLNWYRCQTDPQYSTDLKLFSDKTIDVPSCFVSGSSDWGAFQRPGAIDRMKTLACTNFRDVHLLDGAGHWVQQEQPDQVSNILLNHFG